MREWQRVFGAGPRGAAFSLALLWLARETAERIGPAPIHGSPVLGNAAFALGGLLTAALVAWSLHSLPPAERGARLVTRGAFRWFRHPLYAAFLLFAAPALALKLDHWIYLAWAFALHPLWHVNVRYEERLMRARFGDAYDAYAAVTGRFFPRFRRGATGA